MDACALRTELRGWVIAQAAHRDGAGGPAINCSGGKGKYGTAIGVKGPAEFERGRRTILGGDFNIVQATEKHMLKSLYTVAVECDETQNEATHGKQKNRLRLLRPRLDQDHR